MKITIHQTANTLDPNQTAANPAASLRGYIAALTAELEKEYPGAEVEHVDQDNTRSITCDDGDDDDLSQIQRIAETVYETGLFWE